MNTEIKPEEPAHLKKGRRAFIIRNGRELLQKVAPYQSKQSKVPDTPKIANEHFDFLDNFTDNWKAISEEAKEVLKFRDTVPGLADISPDQYGLAREKKWKVFMLFGFGEKLKNHRQLAPKTCEILETVPNLRTALFSILAPGYHIPAHKGVTKGMLCAHLGLLIPKEREKCRIRVEDTITAWKPGEVFVFDDTYDHEAWNDTDEERVILLFHFDRPMGLGGRILHETVMTAMRMTAFYQDPKKNLRDAEQQLEAAIRRADANIEAMSD